MVGSVVVLSTAQMARKGLLVWKFVPGISRYRYEDGPPLRGPGNI